MLGGGGGDCELGDGVCDTVEAAAVAAAADTPATTNKAAPTAGRRYLGILVIVFSAAAAVAADAATFAVACSCNLFSLSASLSRWTVYEMSFALPKSARSGIEDLGPFWYIIVPCSRMSQL